MVYKRDKDIDLEVKFEPVNEVRRDQESQKASVPREKLRDATNVTTLDIRNSKCTICGLKGSKWSIQNHMSSPMLSKDEWHLCEQCDYASKSVNYLKQHKNSQHEGINHSCDIGTVYVALKEKEVKKEDATEVEKDPLAERIEYEEKVLIKD